MLGHRACESSLRYQMALQSPIPICTPLSTLWDHLLLHILIFVDAVGASHRSPLLAGTPLAQLLCVFLLMAPRCLLAGDLPLAMGVSHLVYSILYFCFLNWVQRVGIKNGSKRRKPRSLSLPSSMTKEDTERGRGGRKERRVPSKKRVGNICFKAASRCQEGWWVGAGQASLHRWQGSWKPHLISYLAFVTGSPLPPPHPCLFLSPWFPGSIHPICSLYPQCSEHCRVPGCGSVFITWIHRWISFDWHRGLLIGDKMLYRSCKCIILPQPVTKFYP